MGGRGSLRVEILPGVFRLADPAVQVRFAAEHRNALERLLLGIPAEVFTTEDALGWVYQFWQTAEKKRVNDSGVKIGGAELPPITQLFTENYMVRFLLENSLERGGLRVTPSLHSPQVWSTSAATMRARLPLARSATGPNVQPK